ncbi:MAG: HipA N-terminal domain-containing protein [Halioglobus sp.]
MAEVSVLEVLLYSEPIGTLTRVEGDRSLFAFNEDHIADRNRPVLGLGFKDKFGELLTEFRPYQTRVMPFFSNLLPEERLRRNSGRAGRGQFRAGILPALGVG